MKDRDSLSDYVRKLRNTILQALRLEKATKQVFKPGQLVYYAHNGSPSGKGLPQTAVARTKLFKPMTTNMIDVWQGCLQVLHPDMSFTEFQNNWRGLTRSNAGFNNGNGSDTDHFKIECGVFSPGRIFRILNGMAFKAGKVWWINVQAFDPLSLYLWPMKLEDIDMALWFFPNAAPGGDTINPFYNNFGGRCLVPGYYPGGAMPVRLDKLIAVDKPRMPFNPPRYDLTAGLIDIPSIQDA